MKKPVSAKGTLITIFTDAANVFQQPHDRKKSYNNALLNSQLSKRKKKATGVVPSGKFICVETARGYPSPYAHMTIKSCNIELLHFNIGQNGSLPRELYEKKHGHG